MEFRKISALRGPNLWANFPVLEAWVDLGELKDRASNEMPGFNERLMAWLPTMIEHRCSIGERGGFFERLRRGTYPAHILEHVTLELQHRAGTPAGFGRARETGEPGVYKVVVRYQEEEVTRQCLLAARELLLAAIHDEPYDVAATVSRLHALAEDLCLGPSTRAIVDAAKARGIPTRRLSTNSLVQLGYGCRARRIQATVTDRTGAIAEGIAQDKQLTRELLRAAGVRVPSGRPVGSEDEAWETAVAIGLPVVVKPRDGNHGRGVSTNLATREQVVAAYHAAVDESRKVIVETFAPGRDYRLLVIGGRLVAAARREPAQVVGDGSHTISQLIDIVNADPRRSDGHASVLSKIHVDAVAKAVLADQGYTPDSVPAAGTVVLIRRNANLSTGGTAIDVTDLVHPAVASQAVTAAKVVGLDVAGIDVVTREISRPLEEQDGVIVEVNAAPGFRMHLEPSAGLSRPVGEALVESLFPDGDNGRIPIAAVTGVNGKTTVTRLLAHLVRGTGKHVGMTSTDGIYFDERRFSRGDCSGPQSARSVLSNPEVEAAVLETARGGILREGLGFDFCDVGVVTNIGEGDHLGIDDVHTLDKLAAVKRCVVEAVGTWGTAVLNAADPLVAAMHARCPGHVLFFALDEEQPTLVAHREAGGRVTFVSNGWIVLAEEKREETLIPLEEVPLTHGGRIRFQVENVLAAVAAAWSLGIPLDTIRSQLRSFTASAEQSPGRFNVVEIEGGTVIVDYGHNSSALHSIVDALGSFPQTYRIVVHSMAGDRRDCDIIREGRILGDAFDHVILYEGHYRRGRPEGEIIRLLTEGLHASSRVRKIEQAAGSLEALDVGLAVAQPGQLLVLQADKIDEAVNYLKERLQRDAALLPAQQTPAETPREAEPAAV